MLLISDINLIYYMTAAIQKCSQDIVNIKLYIYSLLVCFQIATLAVSSNDLAIGAFGVRCHN